MDELTTRRDLIRVTCSFYEVRMWIVFASLSAVFTAGHDVLGSTAETKNLPVLTRTLIVTLVTALLMIPAFFFSSYADLDLRFCLLHLLRAGMLTIASLLYLRALSLGPLSQTQPILALTPVFLAFTNPIITHERVPIVGWIGVVIVGIGLYATQHPGPIKEQSLIRSFLSPIVELLRQPGAYTKLGVAAIYAVTSSLDRVCLDAAHKQWGLSLAVNQWLVTGFLCIALPFVYRGQSIKTQIPAHAWKTLISQGLARSFGTMAHFAALSFAPVPYVIAVKRLSIVLASGWDYFIRKEREPHWYRLIGTLLVAAGITVIVLFGRTR